MELAPDFAFQPLDNLLDDGEEAGNDPLDTEGSHVSEAPSSAPAALVSRRAGLRLCGMWSTPRRGWGVRT